MPRAKKDGVYINLRIERKLRERLESYAEEKGQTMTKALEIILQNFFDEEDKKRNKNEK